MSLIHRGTGMTVNQDHTKQNLLNDTKDKRMINAYLHNQIARDIKLLISLFISLSFIIVL